MDKMHNFFHVPEEMAGLRLDKALTALWPGSGLRRRRRAFEVGAVLVDGASRRPGFRVQAGQKVCVVEPRKKCGFSLQDLEVVADTGRYAAVGKPAGVHSAMVAGSPEPCVEELLPAMFPDRPPLLANRLDKATSGILVVAFGRQALELHRGWEARGLLEKRYLAWVRGVLEEELRLDRELDTAGGSRVRVLDKPAADPLRVTLVAPVRRRPGETLVSVLIRKGARHQIRAHLAWAGLPILGDELYGEPFPEGLMLHHVEISSPELKAARPPDWEAPYCFSPPETGKRGA
jgi:23S rRNA pseudouridine1911/1915/1917 synthase